MVYTIQLFSPKGQMPVKNHADAFKNQAWNVQISSKSTTLQKKMYARMLSVRYVETAKNRISVKFSK
jgi:hypothetical protein